jgi:hypothetical protein
MHTWKDWVLLLGEVLHKFQWNPFSWVLHSSSTYSLGFLCLFYWILREVKVSNIINGYFYSSFFSASFCFLHFEALLLVYKCWELFYILGERYSYYYVGFVIFLFITVLFFFWVVLGFELRASCLLGTLPLESCLQPFLLWLFWR